MKTSKTKILSGLIQVRREIIESITCLPPEKQAAVFLGEWSIKDMLAHFIGWDYGNREAFQALREQRLPGFYAFYDKDWCRYNAHWVETYRNETFEALLKMAVVSHRALMDVLEAVPEAEFHQDFGVRYKGIKVTLSRLLEAEIEEEGVHFEQICSFIAPSERAEAIFLVGFNCSQSVLQVFAPRFNLAQDVAARIATPFGAGIAFQGRQCGAVSGALMVLGLQYGNLDATDKASKALAYTRAREFIERFKERNQSTECRELLGIDLGEPGEYERARELSLFEERCPKFVSEAVQILSVMLDEK